MRKLFILFLILLLGRCTTEPVEIIKVPDLVYPEPLAVVEPGEGYDSHRPLPAVHEGITFSISRITELYGGDSRQHPGVISIDEVSGVILVRPNHRLPFGMYILELTLTNGEVSRVFPDAFTIIVGGTPRALEYQPSEYITYLDEAVPQSLGIPRKIEGIGSFTYAIPQGFTNFYPGRFSINAQTGEILLLSTEKTLDTEIPVVVNGPYGTQRFDNCIKVIVKGPPDVLVGRYQLKEAIFLRELTIYHNDDDGDGTPEIDQYYQEGDDASEFLMHYLLDRDDCPALETLIELSEFGELSYACHPEQNFEKLGTWSINSMRTEILMTAHHRISMEGNFPVTDLGETLNGEIHLFVPRSIDWPMNGFNMQFVNISIEWEKL